MFLQTLIERPPLLALVEIPTFRERNIFAYNAGRFSKDQTEPAGNKRMPGIKYVLPQCIRNLGTVQRLPHQTS